MKRFIAILVVLTICFTNAITVSAMTGDGNLIIPRWNYMNSIEVSIDFNGTNGTAAAEITRIFGVTTKIEATLTVYKRVGSSWVIIDDISGESARLLGLEIEFTAEHGATYKAEVEVTAYGSNGSESDSASDMRTCP